MRGAKKKKTRALQDFIMALVGFSGEYLLNICGILQTVGDLTGLGYKPVRLLENAFDCEILVVTWSVRPLQMRGRLSEN